VYKSSTTESLQPKEVGFKAEVARQVAQCQ